MVGELTKPEPGYVEDPAFVSDEELRALRYRLRRELIEFSRRRLQDQNIDLMRAISSRSITCSTRMR